MRPMYSSDADSGSGLCAGKLLLAHPGLGDPNFNRSVVLISAHSGEEGAMGVVLNRPAAKKLGEFKSGPDFTSLAELPVYFGGPVAPSECLLAGFQMASDGRGVHFYFGIPVERLSDWLARGEVLQAKAFIGYAGWQAGQLEQELEENAWALCPLAPDLLQAPMEDLWKRLLMRFRPEWRLLADAPEDVSGN